MDEGSESENEFDYDDELDEEEEIEDEDAAAEEDHDDGEDDDDEPEDGDGGGANQFIDFGSTIHGVVHELRRLNRSRDGAGDGVYGGILGALNQSAADLGFPQIVLPSQDFHGGVLSTPRGSESTRGEGHDPHQQRLPFGQLPLAQRIHPMLRREHSSNGLVRRQRSFIFRGEDAPIRPPSSQSSTSNHVDTLQRLLRGLSINPDANVAQGRSVGVRHGGNLDCAVDVNEPTEAGAISLDSPSPSNLVRAADSDDAPSSSEGLRERFIGPRDFSRVYGEGRNGFLSEAGLDPSIHTSPSRQLNESPRDNWTAGPSLAAAGGRTALSSILNESSPSALNSGEAREHRIRGMSVQRADAAGSDPRASADGSRGFVLVNRMLTSHVETMLKELTPLHDELQKLKDQYDAARRAVAAAEAEKEIALAAEAEKAAAATAERAADETSRRAAAVEAERVTAEAERAAALPMATPEAESRVRSAEVLNTPIVPTGTVGGTSERSPAPSTTPIISSDAVASALALAVAASSTVRNEEDSVPALPGEPGTVAGTRAADGRDVSASEAANASQPAGGSGADTQPPSSVSQLVEVRAASVGVSLEAPANEDPDVVAAAVANTGIDPTFLAALPEEMRTEVLAQHFERVTTARESEMAELTSTTILAQEFLIALPPALRADVLAQEATYRSRNETGNAATGSAGNPDPAGEAAGVAGGGDGNAGAAGPADTDVATFLASLAPELRREILLTSGDSLVDQLPPHMAAEAQALRERDNARRASAFGTGGHPRSMMQMRRDVLGDGPSGLGRIDDRSGRGHNGARASAREARWEFREQSGVWLRVRSSDVDGATPLCNEKSLVPLLGLLNLRSSQYGKSLLHQVLAALCKRSDTRRQVLDLLFLALPIRFEKGPALSQQNAARTSGKQAGSATESVVVRRALELLTNLCKQEKSVAEDIIAVPCDDPAAVGLSLFVGGEAESSSSPAAALVSLLSTPLFQRSSSHQANLIALLSYAFNVLPPRTAVVKKEPVAALDSTVLDGVESSDNIEVATANPAINEGEIRAEADELAEGDGEAKDKTVTTVTKTVHVPAKFRIPFLRDEDLHSLVNLLLLEGSNEKSYDRITSVLSRASELQANRERALGALTASASKLGDHIASSFRAFVSELPSRELHTARAAAVCKFSMSASTDELKFLRSLKAIVAVIHFAKDSESSEKSSEVSVYEGASDGLPEDPIGEHLDGLRVLWAALDRVLSLARDEDHDLADYDSGTKSAGGVGEQHSEHSEDGLANRSRSDNAEDSGHAGLVYVRPTANGSKSHSLSPMLARLSPVIEAFFVYHGARTASSAGPTSTDSVVVSPRSPSRHSSSSDVGLEISSLGDRELGTFIKRNRSAVNAILRVNPLLLDGSFRSALRHAHAIDFDNKKSYFRNVIRKRSVTSSPVGSLRITVRRDRVFDDSYQQLRSHSAAEMRGRLHVQFNGEEGIDAGGVTREWYVILARQIFDPNYALFCRSAAKAATYQPNKSSFINQEHLDNFRFVGRIFGKAIYDGQLLDAYFTRAFYKHILGIKPTYHDIEAEDPAYYQSLCWILNNDITDVIEETFSSEYEEFGQQRVVDLKPGGRNIAVTEQNKEEYVKLVTEVKLTKAIEQQIAAFKQGFHELIPLDDCRIFNEVELELLTSGLPDIDVADLKAHVDYSGYTAGSPQISWFWNCVSKMGQEDLARFLMFVTGTSKVPIEGFAALQGMNGPQRLSIHRASCSSKTRLPSAHTCFNQLDLPEYDDAETLSERLLVAIRECSVGFGFG